MELDDWKILLISIGVVALIIAAMFGVVILVNKLQCNQYTLLNPTEQFRYNVWSGCMIHWNSLWMPFEAIIIR